MRIRPATLISLTLLLVACTTTPAPPATPPPPEVTWTAFPEQARVTGFETRFRKQEVFALSEGQQDVLRPDCPILTRGHASKESESFYLVTLEGDGLQQGLRVGAILPDKTLADARTQLQDGALQIPVACEHCTLIFGRTLPDGRTAACTGPGYSLTIAEGQLTSP